MFSEKKKIETTIPLKAKKAEIPWYICSGPARSKLKIPTKTSPRLPTTPETNPIFANNSECFEFLYRTFSFMLKLTVTGTLIKPANTQKASCNHEKGNTASRPRSLM
jgi:hypothetical protein